MPREYTSVTPLSLQWLGCSPSIPKVPVSSPTHCVVVVQKNWRPCLRYGPPRSLSVAAGQDCGEVVSGGLPSPEVGGSRCAEERTPEQASGALGTYVPCRLESKQAPVQSTLSSIFFFFFTRCNQSKTPEASCSPYLPINQQVHAVQHVRSAARKAAGCSKHRAQNAQGKAGMVQTASGMHNGAAYHRCLA